MDCRATTTTPHYLDSILVVWYRGLNCSRQAEPWLRAANTALPRGKLEKPSSGLLVWGSLFWRRYFTRLLWSYVFPCLLSSSLKQKCAVIWAKLTGIFMEKSLIFYNVRPKNHASLTKTEFVGINMAFFTLSGGNLSKYTSFMTKIMFFRVSQSDLYSKTHFTTTSLRDFQG